MLQNFAGKLNSPSRPHERHRGTTDKNCDDIRVRPVYSDATQLNSTRRRVELSCVAINGPLVTFAENLITCQVVEVKPQLQWCRASAVVFDRRAFAVLRSTCS